MAFVPCRSVSELMLMPLKQILTYYKKEIGGLFMQKNIIKSEFSEDERTKLADLLHIIVEEIVKEVCND